MRPLNFDYPVLDEEGNIHNLTEYIEEHGGESEPISDSIIEFNSDDTIQNPTESISMPLFQSGNMLKDLMKWISKAFQNVRYLIKKVSDISDDLDTSIEKISDIESWTAKEWTDITVAIAGEYYNDDNKLWKCKITTANRPSEGSEWTEVKILDQVSELNSNLNKIFLDAEHYVALGTLSSYTAVVDCAILVSLHPNSGSGNEANLKLNNVSIAFFSEYLLTKDMYFRQTYYVKKGQTLSVTGGDIRGYFPLIN